MNNDGNSNVKMFCYVALPKGNDKISDYDMIVFNIVKELHVASYDDLLAKIKPDYNVIANNNKTNNVSLEETFDYVKHWTENAKACSCVTCSLIKLIQLGCVKIIQIK